MTGATVARAAAALGLSLDEVADNCPTLTPAEQSAIRSLPERSPSRPAGAAGASVSHDPATRPSAPAASSPTVTALPPAAETEGPAAPTPPGGTLPPGALLDVSAARGRPSLAGPETRGGGPGQPPSARPVSPPLAGRAVPGARP